MLKLLLVLVFCYMVTCREVHQRDAASANCGPDEEFKFIYPCPGEKTCITRDHRRGCPAIAQCTVPHCLCREGLYRAEDGSCYNDEQCNKWKCPGDHEHFECASECDNVCATLDRQNKTNCPIRKYVNFDICSPKCYCDDGYARDDQGNCIPIKDCGVLENYLTHSI
ncbi:unnamed protein product [Chrysodeixis includens]|uniref:TIL domain-containing protein n=1 Tax=Chrysodeixis includens TaxID=689277 RepID=A0A9P0FXX8_CHRIL|nr:unnamed protein product [Chrysodeixis includens]